MYVIVADMHAVELTRVQDRIQNITRKPSNNLPNTRNYQVKAILLLQLLSNGWNFLFSSLDSEAAYRLVHMET